MNRISCADGLGAHLIESVVLFQPVVAAAAVLVVVGLDFLAAVSSPDLHTSRAGMVGSLGGEVVR